MRVCALAFFFGDIGYADEAIGSGLPPIHYITPVVLATTQRVNCARQKVYRKFPLDLVEVSTTLFIF